MCEQLSFHKKYFNFHAEVYNTASMLTLLKQDNLSAVMRVPGILPY